MSVSRNLQLLEDKPNGVRPTVSQHTISEIVKQKTNSNRVCNHKSDTVSPTCTLITVDSGACDAVAPPQTFVNTELNTNDRGIGKVYGACGGEVVRNIGCKSVGFVISTGEKTQI